MTKWNDKTLIETQLFPRLMHCTAIWLNWGGQKSVEILYYENFMIAYFLGV